MRRKSERRDPSVWKTAMAGVLAVGMAVAGFPGSARGQDAKAQALLDKVIAAHGGMQAWDNLRDFTFALRRTILSPQGDVTGASVSLYYMKRFGKARVETLTGKGLQVQGFDGQKPWVTVDGKPDTREEALRAAHFQAINWWYWWGIPFKLKDPGVILQDKGTGASPRSAWPSWPGRATAGSGPGPQPARRPARQGRSPGRTGPVAESLVRDPLVLLSPRRSFQLAFLLFPRCSFQRRVERPDKTSLVVPRPADAEASASGGWVCRSRRL